MSSGNYSKKLVCNGHRYNYYFVCIKLILLSDLQENYVHFHIKGLSKARLNAFAADKEE
jgi:hypothetical protein